MTVETEMGEEVLLKEFPQEWEIVQSLREALGDKFVASKIPRKRRVYVSVTEEAHREAAKQLKAMGIWYTPTIVALDLKDKFEVLFQFFDKERNVHIAIRTPVSKDKPELETITDLFPGTIFYEREVHDLFGIVFRNHPNLVKLLLADTWPADEYPLRKDWKPSAKKVKSRRKIPLVTAGEFLIEVGPQTPTLKEPMNFEVIADGEVVVDIIPHLEYNHRGIEKAMEQRTFTQGIYLSERVCGICSQPHAFTFCSAVERLLDVDVPRRGQYIRTMVYEMNRIHSHLLWVGVAAHLIGWDTLFMYTWRDREVILDMTELITGGRLTGAINTIGGARRDINDDQIHKLRKGLDVLEERTRAYKKIALNEDTLIKRCLGVGIMKPELARNFAAVGPTIRGSGIKADLRWDDPEHGCYDELSDVFTPATSDLCDVAGRLIVRVDETLESVNMIRWILDHLPSGPVRKRVPRRVPRNEAVGRTEAPRGEVYYYMMSNNTDKPERVKIKTPTIANIPAFVESTKGLYIADFVINFGSIDPCIACTCRTTITDISHPRNPKRRVMSHEELRKYGIDWYEDRKWRK
ncbi:MAG: NADH-quinone oxidoreductase subunit C [Promethearchaeota archaeon]